MSLRGLYAGGFFALAAAFLPNGASAQGYPNHEIKIISPTGAGNMTDSTARVLAEDMQKRMGQPIIVENRSGADGFLGMKVASQAPADGYTISIHTGYNALPIFVKDSDLDLAKSFVPITLIHTFTGDFHVNSKLPVKTFDELTAYVKANPGKLKLASGSSYGKLYSYLLEQHFGAPFQLIPYKTTPAAAQAAAMGETEMLFSPAQTVQPFLDSGQVKHLMSTGRKRNLSTPNTPSAVDLGHPNLVMEFTMFAWAPAGTPPDIVERLNSEFQISLKKPEVIEKLQRFGVTVQGTSVAEAKAAFDEGLAYWTKLTKDANYVPQ